MTMKLVIVESPSKAKTIEKYLGKDYRVEASMGHVVDLPKSELAIDVEHNFKPTYEVAKGKEKVLRALRKALKSADELILAVDPDREGEAIGWHLAVKLKVVDEKGKVLSKDKGFRRIVFHEITKGAVNKALEKGGEINMDMVDAQQARRVLDRLVGYKLSPLIWRKIRYGLSAGRVQSVAVRLIVERERE
ncbi:MAG TPA: DNA topoisomerase I, partial [bacterium]|nr:DNA topoisomerase I [bacterium]